MTPLHTRYASKQMLRIFDRETVTKNWRHTWIALAEAQQELGCSISHHQINQLKETVNQIDFERIAEIEKETRHDVVANIKAWSEIAPDAAPIIHLGATSAFVTDNAERISQREALTLVRDRLGELIICLSDLATKHAEVVTMGYTHFQPAQPTTVGKRICLWLQDLVLDFKKIVFALDDFPCRGAKGTTGTAASYYELLKSHAKTLELDTLVAKKLGFKRSVTLSGQTISRKLDAELGDILAGVAISLSKLGLDIRLLSHTGEMYEDFGKKQVGSSAMPYKRNPMKSERLCSLSRLVVHYRNALAETAMTQWLERSLDDSAIRRIVIPESFMAIDGALRVAVSLAKCLTIDEKTCQNNINEYLPFLCVEKLLLAAVEQGQNRQEMHEKLREYAVEAKNPCRQVAANSFYILLDLDPIFSQFISIIDDAEKNHLKLTGTALHQIVRFLANEVVPVINSLSSNPQVEELTV